MFLFCLVVLWLAGLISKAHGQTGNESEPMPLNSSLEQVEATLRTLESRLVERQRQVESLRDNLRVADERLNALVGSYESLGAQLQEVQSTLERSQTDLTATSLSLEALSKRYAELESRWQEYRTEMTTQVVDLERQYRMAKRWAWGFGISTAVGFIVSLLLAIK